MNRSRHVVFAAALLATLTAPAFAAQAIRVDFDLDNAFGHGALPAFAGYFVARDANADGVISFDEVSAFHTGGAGDGPLLSFGEFDIAQNLWTTEHSREENFYWIQATKSGLVTYKDGLQPETVIAAAAAPEASTAALLVVGLASVMAFKGRRQLQ